MTSSSKKIQKNILGLIRYDYEDESWKGTFTLPEILNITIRDTTLEIFEDIEKTDKFKCNRVGVHIDLKNWEQLKKKWLELNWKACR